MQKVLGYSIGFALIILMISTGRVSAQQKLTFINYGTITISALHGPYLIAEQEALAQKISIPRDGTVDIERARIVAESWKEFGLQKPPPPVEGVIDMTYLEEARK